MKAVILCAGKGTRLRPYTYFKPKCMMGINGKPALEYLVDHLYSYGVNDIVVNVHHKYKQIMKHFGTKLLYFYEPNLLGEQGTLNVLRGWYAKDYTFVMNGDTLTNLDLSDMLAKANEKNIMAMDGDVYMGTKLLTPGSWPTSFKSVQIDTDVYWYDIGTKKGLKKARNFYAKKSS